MEIHQTITGSEKLQTFLLSVSIKCDIGSRMKQVLFLYLDASSSDDSLVFSNHELNHLFQPGQIKRGEITNNICQNFRQTCHHLLKLKNVWVYNLLQDREGS